MSEEQQVRLNVHTEKMGTSYANAFQVRYSQDDVLVSFGVSLTDLSAEPGVKGVVTADMLRPYVTDKTKALVINTPNNPNGCIWSRAELQAIADLADSGFITGQVLGVSGGFVIT